MKVEDNMRSTKQFWDWAVSRVIARSYLRAYWALLGVR